jgi:hypothetical protein
VSKDATARLVSALQVCRTRHLYKLVILGPILSRMAHAGNLAGLKKILFELFALSTDEAARRVVKFSESAKGTARITLGAFLFYKVASFGVSAYRSLRKMFFKTSAGISKIH